MSKIDFKEVIIFMLNKKKDNRGFFFELYKSTSYKKSIKSFFLQDNYSRSKKGVLRGLHFQLKKPQGKLLTVIKGKIFDVVIDLRKKSKTFGCWNSYYLMDNKYNQIWIPPGFAHGFMSLSNETNIHYKCTEEYDPANEKTIFWRDNKLNIQWPKGKKILSKKDNNPNLSFESYNF